MTAKFLFVPSEVNRSSGGVTCKIPSDQTDNRYTVLELVLPPGAGAPFHVHQREDEILLVVEGECEIRHGDEIHVAQPGDLIVFPRGQAHAFRNTGQTPNRLMITAVPGGLDRYFAELAALGSGATQEIVDEINRRYEIDFSPRGSA
jgi:mannose-6-phosphate isomerase-like protein (cupin superfamily)